MFRVTQCSWKNKSKCQGNERASPKWAMVLPKLVSAFGDQLIAWDSTEMKFKQIGVKWEMELSGLFKYFYLAHSSTIKASCSLGSARLLLYWFHNVPLPPVLNLCLAFAQKYAPGDQLVANDGPKDLYIYWRERNKYIYIYLLMSPFGLIHKTPSKLRVLEIYEASPLDTLSVWHSRLAAHSRLTTPFPCANGLNKTDFNNKCVSIHSNLARAGGEGGGDIHKF